MDTTLLARANPSAIDQGGAPAASRPSEIDILFTSKFGKSDMRAEQEVREDTRKTEEDESEGRSGKGRAGGSSAGGLRLDISKICVDVTTTGRPSTIETPKNVSLSTLNLLERIKLSAETMWRNPVRTRVSHWGRREVMHVFNGFFAQSSLREWDRYETFGKCYTAPDPFKNDDPPWTACFCA